MTIRLAERSLIARSEIFRWLNLDCCNAAGHPAGGDARVILLRTTRIDSETRDMADSLKAASGEIVAMLVDKQRGESATHLPKVGLTDAACGSRPPAWCSFGGVAASISG